MVALVQFIILNNHLFYVSSRNHLLGASTHAAVATQCTLRCAALHLCLVHQSL